LRRKSTNYSVLERFVSHHSRTVRRKAWGLTVMVTGLINKRMLVPREAQGKVIAE